MTNINSETLFKEPHDQITTFEKWYALIPFGLVLGFIVIWPPPLPGSGDFENLDLIEMGSATRRNVLMTGYLLGIIGILRNRQVFFRQCRQQIPILVLLLYAFLSLSWSSDLTISSRRWVQFLGFLIVAWCAMSYVTNTKSVLVLIRWVLGIALILSFVQSVFEPPDGAWRGIHTHRNVLGLISALAFSLWLPRISLRAPMSRNGLAFGFVILSVFMALMSTSATARIGIFLIFLIWLLLRNRLSAIFKTTVSIIIIAGLLFSFFNFQGQSFDTVFLQTTGRDSTLTGRTILWKYVLYNFEQHPLFGVGYNGFWNRNPVIEELHSEIGWLPSQAHNGYLDILNELGAVGFALFIIVLFHLFYRTIRIYRFNANVGLTYALVILFIAIHNLSESSFCRGTSTAWGVFLLIYVTVSNHYSQIFQSEARSDELMRMQD